MNDARKGAPQIKTTATIGRRTRFVPGGKLIIRCEYQSRTEKFFAKTIRRLPPESGAASGDQR